MKMIFIIAVTVVTSQYSLAQNQFGLNGGLQLTSLHDDESTTKDFESARVAFRIGGFYKYEIGKHWGFHTEMSYSLAGVKSDENVNLHYLSVPLLVYYSPMKKLKIYLGPEFNLLLGTKPKNYAPLGEHFKKIDRGLTVGVEFLASERIGIFLRNYFGLNFNTTIEAGIYAPVIEGDPVVIPKDLKMNRNNMLQLGVNYYFKRN